MPPAYPASILIVRLSAIGDVIHTLPCLHALRQAFPKARIGWLVEELSAALLRGHPELNDLFVIPKKRWRKAPLQHLLNGEKAAFYRELRREKWDAAIDFQGLTKSALPTWLSGAKTRVGFAGKDGRELSKIFYNRRVTPPASAIHVIQRNLALLEPLGVRVSDAEVGWVFPDFAGERAELSGFLENLAAPASARRKFIALYPGAGWETKRWPPGHFSRMARLLVLGAASASAGLGSLADNGTPTPQPLPLVLLWGPGEEELCNEVIKTAELPPDRLLMAPRTNLRQLAALTAEAAVFVGGDTGPTHLATALGVPVVGIYGGSDPVRNGAWDPTGQFNAVLQAKEIPCVPCWKTICARAEHIECLKAVTPDSVARMVLEKLKKS